MKDLEEDLISKDIMKICTTVAHYVCKKKTKQLVMFFITQYNDYYLNDNVMCIRFIYDRISTLQNHSYSYTNRIVRVTIVEMFVMMALLQRNPKIKLQIRSGSNTSKITETPKLLFQKQFPILFRGKTISCRTYLHGINRMCNLDSKTEATLQELIYHCVYDYQPEIITKSLSELFRCKAIVKLTTLKQQYEVSDINLQDSFISVLSFVCLSLCNDEKKAQHCKHLFHLIALKPNFNLMLMAFNIMACNDFHRKYTNTNSFYFPIILQCSMKIEYVYDELFNTEYKHLLKKIIHETVLPYDEKEKEKEAEDEFDPLFTIPEIKEKNKVKSVTSKYYVQNKMIILKTSSSVKDKSIYNISKNNEAKDFTNPN